MLTLEYKIDGTPAQYAAIEEAIRTVQFVRNKCLRWWMDADKEHPVSANDLQKYCAVLAKEFPFADALNSTARQAAADRVWFAIARFFANCQSKKLGKKGYPRFQHDNRSVEYKRSGWQLALDGRHLTLTDDIHIGTVRLIGKKKTGIVSFSNSPDLVEALLVADEELDANPNFARIKRVRMVRRADGYFCQFCVETAWEVPHVATNQHLGIDVGLNAYYTDSQGTKVENPRFIRQAGERLARRQRQVSRKGIRYKKTKKPIKTSTQGNRYPKGQPAVSRERSGGKQWHRQPHRDKTLRRWQRPALPPKQVVNHQIPPVDGEQSHNYHKARKRLACTYLHLQRQREDFARKTAKALISSCDLIAYEDLQIRNLVKNHHLAKAISDVGWGRFLWWVRYYAAQQGIPCIAVPPQFTSQDCSGSLPDGTRCPQRVQKSLSVRTHVCPRCGLVIDRDHNSGKLVLERALLSVPSGRREQAHPA